MSVTPAAGGRTGQVARLVIAVGAILLMAGVLDAVLAQGTPFGAPKGAPPSPPPDGILGWIFAKQNEFYRQFSALIRAAKADGSAVWGLLGVSFLYGVFHAAGPGHGKAVISSYVVANDETWLRGVALSFASALLQALVAVTFVGIAAAILQTTASTMNIAVNAIESVSYGLIILIGLRLLWVKGRGLIAAARALQRPPPELSAAVAQQPQEYHANSNPHLNHHSHDDHGHSHGHAHQHDHDVGCEHAHPTDRHDHLNDNCSAWGHAHAPEPEELGGPGGWQRGLSAVVAVGLRPCSGAIIVLVFALANDLFWAGVGATFTMGLGT